MIGDRRGGDGFCSACNLRGEPCRAPAMRGEKYCLTHLPGEAADERRRAMRSKGGRNVSERRRLLVGVIDFSTPASVRCYFEALAKAVLRGEIPPPRATAACQIAEAALRVKAGIELGERLDTLESAIQGLSEERLGPETGVGV